MLCVDTEPGKEKMCVESGGNRVVEVFDLDAGDMLNELYICDSVLFENESDPCERVKWKHESQCLIW